MKERPILFSAPMVKAILAGTKTMTRRIVKPQADIIVGDVLGQPKWYLDRDPSRVIRCPYGAPGDRLWVRETWAAHFMYDAVAPTKARSKLPDDNTWYAADGDGASGSHGCPASGCRGKWRPSIHMPRWVSRIDLEVTEVCVERLQDITEEDAKAEGVDHVSIADVPRQAAWSRRQDFSVLWDKINGGKAPWKSNPWVWVVSFKRVRP